MKKKTLNSSTFHGTRLWTGIKDTTTLLSSKKDDASSTMLQHARVAEVTKAASGKRRRKFVISTETPDRHGDIVRAAGIGLTNFKKNPVVLFSHESHMPPIGTSPNIALENKKQLGAEVDFFARDVYDFADTIFRIVDAGGLKSTSIGFIPKEWDSMEGEEGEGSKGFEFTKSELLEFSIVPIPANPDCVMRAFHDGAAMKPLVRYLEDQQDNFEKMADVFLSLGFDEKHINTVRRAAQGRRTLVGYEGKSKKKDDDAGSLIVTRTIRVGEKDQIELVGSFPEHTKISKEMLDNPHVVRVGDNVTFNFANATALYDVEEEEADHVVCGLMGSEEKDFVIQSVAGRKSQWSSREAFLEWAKEAGFETDKVVSIKTFWRLEQRSADDFSDLRLGSVEPEDDTVDPTSKDCKVQAKGGVLKASVKADEEDGEDEDEEEEIESIVVRLDSVIDELIAEGKDLSEEDMTTLTGAVEKLVKFLNDEDEDEEDDSEDEEDNEESDEEDEGKEFDASNVPEEDMKELLAEMVKEELEKTTAKSKEEEDEDEEEEET